jgi:sec-independent protein translocase protein TatA
MSSLVSRYAMAGFSLNPGNWGIGEMAIIFVLVLIFFGPKRLPQLAQSLGKAITDFKRGLHEVREDIERVPEEPKPAANPRVTESAEKEVSVPPVAAENQQANSH